MSKAKDTLKAITETGEPDQDYDQDFYNAVCKKLKKAGFDCSHREFDKYQGVYIKITSPSVKLWTTDMYVSGKPKKDNAKYSRAILVDNEGGTNSATRGDYFNLPKTHVFKNMTLVLTDLQGKKNKIENPKISDLPDLLDVRSTISFEGSETHHYTLQSDSDGKEMEVTYRDGDVDVSGVTKYLKSLLKKKGK
jgi:hypothetical protein